MIIHNCEQGSDEWFAVKLGKVSASHFKDVLNQKTGRKLYMYRLLGERLSGENCAGFTDKNTEKGVELEPEARRYYEALYDIIIPQVGFVEKNEYLGCSPDGLIGEDGGIEIKCPLASTHISYIDKNQMPSAYKDQVHGCMWITGRKWWDIVSYCPEVKVRPFWSKRIARDIKEIKILEIAVETFISELKTLEEKVVSNKASF